MKESALASRRKRAAAKASPFRTALFDQTTALAQGYRLIAESIWTRAQDTADRTRARFFEARQTLFETIVEDRTKAQSVIDYQERWITDFNRRLRKLRLTAPKPRSCLLNRWDRSPNSPSVFPL